MPLFFPFRCFMLLLSICCNFQSTSDDQIHPIRLPCFTRLPSSRHFPNLIDRRWKMKSFIVQFLQLYWFASLSKLEKQSTEWQARQALPSTSYKAQGKWSNFWFMRTPQPFKHLSNSAHWRMRITFLSPLWLFHIYFSCVSPFHCNRREWYFDGSNAVALFLPLLFDQRASENECRPELSSILQSIPVHPLEYHLPPLLSFFVIRFSYGCSNSFALHARLCSFSL